MRLTDTSIWYLKYSDVLLTEQINQRKAVKFRGEPKIDLLFAGASIFAPFYNPSIILMNLTISRWAVFSVCLTVSCRIQLTSAKARVTVATAQNRATTTYVCIYEAKEVEVWRLCGFNYGIYNYWDVSLVPVPCRAAFRFTYQNFPSRMLIPNEAQQYFLYSQQDFGTIWSTLIT